MGRSCRILIVSLDYTPLRTSAAVQLRDLAQQFLALGQRPTVIVPSVASNESWNLECSNGVEVMRIGAAPTRVPTHFRRAIAEMLLPLVMLRGLRKSPLRSVKWDLIVWYSPPIFFGPLVWVLKRSCGAPAYLILRDIFPEWAVDLGIIKKGPAYHLLKAFAAIQYAVADVIGIQTESNLSYLPKWIKSSSRQVEVLHNWLAVTPDIGCSIQLKITALAGRTIFVYIGNMGVAQGMEILIELAASLHDRKDIGFLFVGRGTEFANLVAEKASRSLSNILFYDEIDSLEIPGLLAQCHIGLVALHPDHKTHNIPGKFVSYVQYGLPVLARINAGTDLQGVIESNGVGRVYTGDLVAELKPLAEELADNAVLRHEMSKRSKQLGQEMFSSDAAAKQIVSLVNGNLVRPGNSAASLG